MFNYLGKVKREFLSDSGEQIVSLEIIRDTDTVELSDGDEFVTLTTEVDLFTVPNN